MMFTFMSKGKWFKKREKKVINSDKMVEKEVKEETDPEILEVKKQIELLADNILESHQNLEVEISVKHKTENKE